MEFAAGLLIGIVGTYISFLALREQLKQANKRIHYVRFVSPFLVSRDDATRKAVEFYLHGRQLINPHIYLVEIENSGKVPIVPDDFDSPIMVRLNQSVFASAVLSWNRPDVLRKEHQLEMSSRELAVGPLLLNPGDALTLIALVETAEDDLSVIARLAGIEQIIQIPPSEWASQLRFVNEDYLARSQGKSRPPQRSRTSVPSQAMECVRFRWPLVANPNGKAEPLLDDIEVRVNGAATRNPTMFTYGMTNRTGRKLSPSDFGGPIRVRSSKSVFRHGDMTRVGDLDEPSQLSITRTDHEVVIDPPELNEDETLNLCVILDGPGDDLEISSPLVPFVIWLALVPDEDSSLSVRLDQPAHGIRGLPARIRRFTERRRPQKAARPAP